MTFVHGKYNREHNAVYGFFPAAPPLLDVGQIPCIHLISSIASQHITCNHDIKPRREFGPAGSTYCATKALLQLQMVNCCLNLGLNMLRATYPLDAG